MYISGYQQQASKSKTTSLGSMALNGPVRVAVFKPKRFSEIFDSLGKAGEHDLRSVMLDIALQGYQKHAVQLADISP